MSASRSRKDLTLKEKVDVIKRIQEERLNFTQAAESYGISRSQVSRIHKNKENILHQYSQQKSNPSMKRKREGKSADVDEALFRWYEQSRVSGLPVHGNSLKEKASQYAAQLGVENFKATEGWFYRWKQRHNISYHRTHGEKADADVQAADSWKLETLPTILRKYSDNVSAFHFFFLFMNCITLRNFSRFCRIFLIVTKVESIFGQSQMEPTLMLVNMSQAIRKTKTG